MHGFVLQGLVVVENLAEQGLVTVCFAEQGLAMQGLVLQGLIAVENFAEQGFATVCFAEQGLAMQGLRMQGPIVLNWRASPSGALSL